MAYRKKYRLDPESSEVLLPKSPHNGYLELAAEGGALVLIIFLVSFFYLIIKCLNSYKFKKNNYIFCGLFISLSFAVAVLALFSFPIEGPYPFLIMAIVLGPALVNEYEFKIKVPRVFFGLLILILFPLAFFYSYSKYLQNHVPQVHTKLMTASCYFFPSNWKNCMNLCRNEIELGSPENCEKIALRQIKFQKNNFIARRIYSIALFRSGKKEKGCLQIGEYERLFDNKGELQDFYLSRCSTGPK